MSEIKITRKKATGIILLLVVSLAITDWLEWREPEWESSYDSSLISKGEVLDIAEQLIVYQIKQDIEPTGEKLRGYHLHLFNGQFKSEFFERFDQSNYNQFPAVNGVYPRQATRRNTIHIIRFVQSERHTLEVVFSKKIWRKMKKKYKATFKKTKGEWRYLHGSS